MKATDSRFRQIILPFKNLHAFTLLELLVVMAIIMVIAGLTLATSSFVHTKAAKARTTAEIESISLALDNYKAEMGEYPQLSYPPQLTANELSPPNVGALTFLTAVTKYIPNVIPINGLLSKDPNSTNFNMLRLALCPPPVLANNTNQPGGAYATYTNYLNPTRKIFFTPNKSMIAQTTNIVYYDQTLDPYESFVDPFGYAICYICPAVMNPSNSYDLWSSGGSTNTNAWIKNW
ncbi:MAG: type II secretion system protein [Chthoniobacterales bacterium]